MTPPQNGVLKKICLIFRFHPLSFPQKQTINQPLGSTTTSLTGENTKNWYPKGPLKKSPEETLQVFPKLMPRLLFRDNLFFGTRTTREREGEKIPIKMRSFNHLGNGDCFGILDETFWQDQKLLECRVSFFVAVRRHQTLNEMWG